MTKRKNPVNIESKQIVEESLAANPVKTDIKPAKVVRFLSMGTDGAGGLGVYNLDFDMANGVPVHLHFESEPNKTDMFNRFKINAAKLFTETTK